MILAGHRAHPAVHIAQLGHVVLTSVSVYAITLFAFVSLSRLSYPFELEWMEGAILDHIQRVTDGQSIYGPPSLSFTPFIYPPFYYELSSLIGARAGFMGPRLVSVLATAGTMFVLLWIVRRKTSSWTAGIIAAGLYAATYPFSGFWFDLARIDSLFVFLLCAAYGAFTCFQSTPSGAITAILLVMACFTKQTAAALCAPILAHCVLRPNRRALLTVGTLLTASTCWYLWENTRSGGWFQFYIVEIPRGHPIDWSSLGDATLEFVNSPAGLGLASLAFGAPLLAKRAGLVDCRKIRTRIHFTRSCAATFALAGGGLGAAIGTSLVSRLHVGGYVNVWMPACAGAALAVGLVIGLIQGSPAWNADDRPASRVGMLLLSMLVLGGELRALRDSPTQQIPTASDEQAGQQFLAYLRSQPSPVLMLDAGYYARITGHPSTSHPMALADLYKTGDSTRLDAVSAEFRDAMASHRFAAVIGELGLGFLPHEIASEIESSYRKTDGIFRVDDYRFMTRTGCPNRPSTVWKPR